MNKEQFNHNLKKAKRQAETERYLKQLKEKTKLN